MSDSSNAELRALAVAFTTAVATAGRLAEELDGAVDDLNAFIEMRDGLEAQERRHRDAPSDTDTGEERRRRD